MNKYNVGDIIIEIDAPEYTAIITEVSLISYLYDVYRDGECLNRGFDSTFEVLESTTRMLTDLEQVLS